MTAARLALALLILIAWAGLATAGPIQSAVALDAYVFCGPTNWQYETYWASPGPILVERSLFYAEAYGPPTVPFSGHIAAWEASSGNPYLGYWSPPHYLGPGQTMLEIGGALVNGLVRIVYGCTGPSLQGTSLMMILYYRTTP